MDEKKIKLTAKQKEALSYTPLFLCWSEMNPNSCSWSSNWNRKFFTQRTIDSLKEKGLLYNPPSSHYAAEPDNTQVHLTEKAKELGFIENEKSLDNEHTIPEKKKVKKVRVSGELKKGKLYKELDIR